jgi:hypothetical protein
VVPAARVWVARGRAVAVTSAASGNVCLVGGVTPSRALGGESLRVRSTVVGFHVVGVQTVEEFPDRPLGSEHVKGHMLTVLRNDFVFALRL